MKYVFALLLMILPIVSYGDQLSNECPSGWVKIDMPDTTAVDYGGCSGDWVRSHNDMAYMNTCAWAYGSIGFCAMFGESGDTGSDNSGKFELAGVCPFEI